MVRDFFSALFAVDERFIMHRYYSTRLAVIVGVVVAGIWINYDFFVNDILQYELLIVLIVIAVTKVAAMIYYRLTG